MSDIKHSRGPWTFGRQLTTKELQTYFTDDGGDFIEIDSPTHGALAIVVWRMEDDERSPVQEANAHTIVAATELLEALRLMVYCHGHNDDELFNVWVQTDGANQDLDDQREQALARARTAIAKATGVQS